MTGLTQELAAANLVYPGYAWRGDLITFSIPKPGSVWIGYPEGAEPYSSYYGTLNTFHADLFRQAIALFDEIIAPKLLEVDDLVGPGDIRIAVTKLPEGGAWAYLPPHVTQSPGAINGDVWIDHYQVAVSADLFLTFLHELGHAFGLKHPRDEPNVLPVEFQMYRLTVMGGGHGDYGWSFPIVTQEGGAVSVTPMWVLPEGLMVADIAALQALYGADPETRAGDTVYTFDLTRPFLRALYDAGGTDVFDLSGHVRPSLVDLTPGAYSSIGIWAAADQRQYFATQYPSFAHWSSWGDDERYTFEKNLGLSFSTTIENVLGGSGSDTISGNAVSNTLSGGAGADRIFGAAGADSLIGGDGQDFLRGEDGDDWLSGGAEFDDMHGNMGADVLEGGLGGDWVVGGKGDDALYGQDGNDIVYGNMDDDRCVGGDGDDTVRGGQGNDIVAGQAGDDWLSGDRGDDTITGGTGSDTFNTFAGCGLDRVDDFNAAEGDRVRVEAGAYTVRQSGADTIIDFGSGDQMILVGVDSAKLPAGWIVAA